MAITIIIQEQLTSTTVEVANVGEKGSQGLKGDQGIQGIQGIQGLKGDKGDQGNLTISDIDTYFSDFYDDSIVSLNRRRITDVATLYKKLRFIQANIDSLDIIPSMMLEYSVYKYGKLYNVLPASGGGDMGFVRNTVISRIDENGLTDLVPINTPVIDFSSGVGVLVLTGDVVTGVGDANAINSTSGTLFFEGNVTDNSVINEMFIKSIDNTKYVGLKVYANGTLTAKHTTNETAPFNILSNIIFRAALIWDDVLLKLVVNGVEKTITITPFLANELSRLDFYLSLGNEWKGRIKKSNIYSIALSSAEAFFKTTWISFNELATTLEYKIK